MLGDFSAQYDENDEQNVWFDKIKAIGEKYGFCPNIKEYKANPEAFKGSVADASSFIRIAVTGKLNSPDLYVVMKLLGKEETMKRIERYHSTI